MRKLLINVCIHKNYISMNAYQYCYVGFLIANVQYIPVQTMKALQCCL